MEQLTQIQKFENECYKKLEKDFFIKDTAFIAENIKEIETEFRKNLEIFLEYLYEKQEKNEIKSISKISISIPQISICNNKPYYLFEVYDEFVFINKCKESAEYEINTMLKNYSEQIELIMAEVVKQNLNLHISKGYVEAYHAKVIRKIMPILTANLKFFIKQIEFNEWYKKLNKSEDFAISFGGYYDYQKVIFARNKKLDILENTEEKVFTFMRYKEEIFENKKFKKIEIENCLFERCQFINCEFEKISLCDTEFVSSYFENCNFNEVKMYGTKLNYCELKNIEMEAIKTNCIKDNKIKYFLLYGFMEMESCKIENLVVKNSDFSAFSINDSKIKGFQQQGNELSEGFVEFLEQKGGGI